MKNKLKKNTKPPKHTILGRTASINRNPEYLEKIKRRCESNGKNNTNKKN